MSNKNFIEKLHELTKEEIAEKQIAHEYLWLIQVDLETKGPFHLAQLKEVLDEHAEELSQCMTCNLKFKNWKPFFEHSQFQKRKSKSAKPIIKAEEQDRRSYYLLVNGQKKGPYTVKKILSELESGEIKMNNLLSADGGKSWRKVFHFPHFDRRKEVGIDLSVETPDDDHFEKSRVYSTQALKKLNLKKDEEAFEKALLACQQHLKNKKSQLLSRKKEPSVSSSPSTNNPSFSVPSKFSLNKKTATNLMAGVLVILLVGLFVFDEKKSSKKKSITTKSKPTIKRETTPSDSKVKKRTRSKYSSRERTRRRQDNLDNSDLEYNERSRKYRSTDDDQEIVRKQRETEDFDAEFDETFQDDDELVVDEGFIDSDGRNIALDPGFDVDPDAADIEFEEGVEELDY